MKNEIWNSTPYKKNKNTNIINNCLPIFKISTTDMDINEWCHELRLPNQIAGLFQERGAETTYDFEYLRFPVRPDQNQREL